MERLNRTGDDRFRSIGRRIKFFVVRIFEPTFDSFFIFAWWPTTVKGKNAAAGVSVTGEIHICNFRDVICDRLTFPAKNIHFDDASFCRSSLSANELTKLFYVVQRNIRGGAVDSHQIVVSRGTKPQGLLRC